MKAELLPPQGLKGLLASRTPRNSSLGKVRSEQGGEQRMRVDGRKREYCLGSFQDRGQTKA